MHFAQCHVPKYIYNTDLLQGLTRLGKVNALLDRAGELRHALLQGILLI